MFKSSCQSSRFSYSSFRVVFRHEHLQRRYHHLSRTTTSIASRHSLSAMTTSTSSYQETSLLSPRTTRPEGHHRRLGLRDRPDTCCVPSTPRSLRSSGTQHSLATVSTTPPALCVNFCEQISRSKLSSASSVSANVGTAIHVVSSMRFEHPFLVRLFEDCVSRSLTLPLNCRHVMRSLRGDSKQQRPGRTAEDADMA